MNYLFEDSRVEEKKTLPRAQSRRRSILALKDETFEMRETCNKPRLNHLKDISLLVDIGCESLPVSEQVQVSNNLM